MISYTHWLDRKDKIIVTQHKPTSTYGSINKQAVAPNNPTACRTTVESRSACCARVIRNRRLIVWYYYCGARFIYRPVQCRRPSTFFFPHVPRAVSRRPCALRLRLSLLPFTVLRQLCRPRPCRNTLPCRPSPSRQPENIEDRLVHARGFFGRPVHSLAKQSSCSSTCSSGTCWSCGTSSSDR
jgi:hypothetical protein